VDETSAELNAHSEHCCWQLFVLRLPLSEMLAKSECDSHANIWHSCHELDFHVIGMQAPPIFRSGTALLIPPGKVSLLA